MSYINATDKLELLYKTSRGSRHYIIKYYRVVTFIYELKYLVHGV